jgi:hypothetical protein
MFKITLYIFPFILFKVNAEKKKIFIFSRGRPLVHIHFSLNGSEIEIVNEFNYLGIHKIVIGFFPDNQYFY